MRHISLFTANYGSKIIAEENREEILLQGATKRLQRAGDIRTSRGVFPKKGSEIRLNTVTYQYLLEKCGAEAVCSAIAVCLISAFVKKKFKVNKRIQTAVELSLSFVVAFLVATVVKDGDYSDLVSSGLGTAGVALAVCGFICGDCKAAPLTEDAVDVIVNLKSDKPEEIKQALTELPDLGITPEEAEAIAFLAAKLKEKNK